MELTCQFDTRNLMRAQMILLRHTNTAPALIINRTALAVARTAQKLTWAVGQEKIDTELRVQTLPVVKIATRGPRKGTLIKTGKSVYVHDFPRSEAMMIVLARMQTPGISVSTDRPNFNLITGNRWALAKPTMTMRSGAKRIGQGLSNAAQFWAWVEQVADRMIAARHSSSGFLKHSWAAIIMRLLPFANDGGGTPDTGSHAVLLSGEVDAAKPGSAVVVCKISNTIGMNNPNSVLGEKYNKAAHEILEPVLQAAINSEFVGKLEYANKQEWARLEPELKELGMLI